MDKLTYAAIWRTSQTSIVSTVRVVYFFEHADICDFDTMKDILTNMLFDTVIHFAAESHVDRSIHGPKDLYRRTLWGPSRSWRRRARCGRSGQTFSSIISAPTRLYGSLGDSGYFYEHTAYDPRSPIRPPRRRATHLVLAYYHTMACGDAVQLFQQLRPLPVPRKVIPLMISNIQRRESLFRVRRRQKTSAMAVRGRSQQRGMGNNQQRHNRGDLQHRRQNEWENIRLVHVLARRCGISREG